MNDLHAADRAEIEALVGRMEAAWNRADAAAFAAPFAHDADFVNVNGFHARGRKAITLGHDGIFRSVYAGSAMSYAVKTLRLLAPGVALLHVHARLQVPAGPMRGDHEAVWSAVLTRGTLAWEIAALHNTFVRNANAARDVEEQLRIEGTA
jgi:uncharacterized protein (TIGR02246 family)